MVCVVYDFASFLHRNKYLLLCYHETAGVVGTENGLYLGYLFGDAQFSNHDNKGANIYFCVRKKQNHTQRIPSNWD